MIAGGTELAQFFIEGRSPLIKDFLLDACGGSTGISIIFFFQEELEMKELKKEILTIVILAVMAMTGIYVANASPVELKASSSLSISVLN